MLISIQLGNIEHYLYIVFNSFIVYLFILIAIRIFGKKEIAQLSVIDLVFILLISNSVQNAMVGGDNSLQGGMAAALGLFITNYIFKWLIRQFPIFSKLVQGQKILLIHEGKLIKENLKKSMITQDELEEVIREHGVKEISDVDLAVFEIDGNISVLSKDYTHRSIHKKGKLQLMHNP